MFRTYTFVLKQIPEITSEVLHGHLTHSLVDRRQQLSTT